MSAANKPYEGDALGRQQFSEGLTTVIRWLPKGVIAIDGEWGAGKTWFGERLKTDLDNRGDITTLWLDAFEADWDDDPAMSLIAGIAEGLVPQDKSNFLDKVCPYLLAAVPGATSALIKSGLNYFGANEEVRKGLMDVVDSVKTGGEILIKKHLEEISKRKSTLESLKNLLNKSVKDGDKKLVIFVDELDRCSPAYAVRFLERLKHLFDLEGVVYVLLWNRQQIQSAVETFYGAGTSGQMYLDKFVDYPLHLSAVGSYKKRDELPFEELIKNFVELFETSPIPNAVERLDGEFKDVEFVPTIAAIAVILNLTAREIYRLAAWWVMSPNRQFPVLEIWLLGIKVKHPDIFSGLRAHNPEAHTKASQILMATRAHLPEKVATLVSQYRYFHKHFPREMSTEFPGESEFRAPGTNWTQAVDAAVRRLEQDFG